MADDSCNHCRNAEHARPCHSIWKHCEEETGRQFGIHGTLCICSCFDLLGHLGL